MHKLPPNGYAIFRVTLLGGFFMRALILLFSAVIIMLPITACTNGDEATQSSTALAQDLIQITNALQQQSFRFDGTSSLRGDNFNQENIVNFTGVVGHDRGMYLRLLTAQEENGLVEDMDLYAKGNQLYMRFADQVEWDTVGNSSSLFETEMNHWNPLAHLQRMQTMTSNIEHVSSKSNFGTIRVFLNDEALQNEMINNIRERVDAYDNKDRAELAKSLSTGVAGEQGIMEELEGLHNILKQDLNDLDRTTRISGHYTIQYDKKSMLPTKITYVQTIDYSHDGRNETEISETDITLTRFGENSIPVDLP